MRSAQRYLLVHAAVLALAACGGGSSETTATGTTTATASTETSAGPTTGGAPTSSGDTTSVTTSAAATSSGDTSTGETGPVTTSVPGTETGPGSEGTDTGETGGEFVACVDDSDCTLVDDCCSCEPIGPGEQAPLCDVKECITTTCGPMGLSGAAIECRFGRCTFIKISCNPIQVVCNSLPPECPGTQVPSVDIDEACWTGQCVPAEACDWVPDCAYCDDDESICVQKLQKGPYTVCAPRPADCEGEGDVDCGCGAQVCEASPPHTACHDVMGDIACECAQC